MQVCFLVLQVKKLCIKLQITDREGMERGLLFACFIFGQTYIQCFQFYAAANLYLLAFCYKGIFAQKAFKNTPLLNSRYFLYFLHGCKGKGIVFILTKTDLN